VSLWLSQIDFECYAGAFDQARINGAMLAEGPFAWFPTDGLTPQDCLRRTSGPLAWTGSTAGSFCTSSTR
jgi:hypothetical protein